MCGDCTEEDSGNWLEGVVTSERQGLKLGNIKRIHNIVDSIL